MWELDCEESLALKNWCFWTVVLEKTLESPLDCKEIQPVHPKWGSVLDVHWKDCCWIWDSSTLATSCEELTHLERPWCWERLRVGGDRGLDDWMASLTWWTWVCVNSGSWWWTGRPGVLRFMGSQRVGHYWLTEPNWTKWSHVTSANRSVGWKEPFSLPVMESRRDPWLPACQIICACLFIMCSPLFQVFLTHCAVGGNI